MQGPPHPAPDHNATGRSVLTHNLHDHPGSPDPRLVLRSQQAVHGVGTFGGFTTVLGLVLLRHAGIVGAELTGHPAPICRRIATLYRNTI